MAPPPVASTIGLLRGELGDDFAFALAEAGLAFLLEDQGNVHAGAALDLGSLSRNGARSSARELPPTAVLPEPIGPIR